MSLSKLMSLNGSYLMGRARYKHLLEITTVASNHHNHLSLTSTQAIQSWKTHHVIHVSPTVFTQKRNLFKTFIQTPGTGVNMPGQGLKKIDKHDEELEKKSVMLQLISKWEKEQQVGMEKFPIFPDYKFFTRLFVKLLVMLYIGALLWPEFLEIFSDLADEPVVNKSVKSTATQSPVVYLYKSLPLRFISRCWGRICNVEVFQFLRPAIFGAYAMAFNVNMEEALVKDLKVYPSLGEFFRRPLDLSCRPINTEADVVLPCDGKILSCGKIESGLVEQVKGVTYSIQKFLGPLTEEPSHDKWGRQDNYKYNWSNAPLQNYHPALMQDPEKNDLYQCVIYLAPGDYHRFHSPVEWNMKHRRHFPGDLLSVNPRIANIVKDLFVLNERVALTGSWKHGFFSVNPVGATNVGSIKVYEDVWLETNRIRFKYGTYFEEAFGEDGYEIDKGEALGEFNLGSTIVLIFEAPKGMKFNIQPGDSVKMGEKLI